MYGSHFGLHRPAFNNTPDPTFYYSTPDHEEALATLQYATQERKGFVLLTGEVGAGKTLVGRMFLREIEPQARTAVITHTHLSGRQLLAAICTEFELDPPPEASNLELTRLLHDFLLEQYANGQSVVVLLDEAQGLPDESFEELRMLGNLEADDAKLLQICILGQPELRQRIARPNMKQLEQRLFRRFHLPALTRQRTREYIQHRLKVAGCSDEGPFTPEAMDKIYTASKGIPRLINQICDNGLLAAYAKGAQAVDEQSIDEVLEREGAAERPREPDASTSAPAAAGSASVYEKMDRRIEQIYGSAPAISCAVEGGSPVTVGASSGPPREQDPALADAAACLRGDLAEMAEEQSATRKILGRAAKRWRATKETLETHRKEIETAVDEVASRCQSAQAQIEQLSRTAVSADNLGEIRQVHLAETNRLLDEMTRQRAEFQRLTDQAESRCAETQKRVNELSSTAATGEALEELDARHDRRIEDALGRIEQCRDRIADLGDTVRERCDQTQDSLNKLREAHARTRAELIEQVDGRLAEARQEVAEQLKGKADGEQLDSLRQASGRSLADLRNEHDEALSRLREQLKGREVEIESLREQVSGKLDATREQIEALAGKSATADGLQQLRAEHAAALSDLAGRFTKQADAIESVRLEIAEQARAASDEQKAQLEELTERVISQARQLKELRQRLLAQHAANREQMDELAERFASRIEVQEIRQTQAEQSTDLLNRIETNHRALQELIQGAVDRCRSTQDRLDAVASSKADEKDLATFQVRHEEEVSHLLDLLTAHGREIQERFDQTASRWNQTQEDLAELSANAAEARLVEEVRQQQAVDTEQILASIDSQRRDIESLVGGVNQRCERLVERVNELPADIATTDDLKALQAEHAEQVRRFSEELASRKTRFEQVIRDFAERFNQTRQRIDTLASNTASIEDLDGLREQHNETVNEIMARIDRERTEQQQKAVELNRRWDALAARAASVEDVEGLREQHAETAKEIMARIDRERTEQQQEVADLNHRWDELANRAASIEDLKGLRERHAQTVKEIMERIDRERGEQQQEVVDLNHRWDELANRAASIEDLEGLREQHTETANEITQRIERERREQHEKVAKLNRRWEALDESLKKLAATATPASKLKKVEQSFARDLASLGKRVSQVRTKHEQNVQTLAGAICQATKRVTTLEEMDRPKPIEITLTPEAASILAELVATAQIERKQMRAELDRAKEIMSPLRELATQAQELMQEWRENSETVRAESEQLRTSANAAADILRAMQQCHVVLDAKLNSEAWQEELARGEDLTTRLERATHTAQTASQQVTHAARILCRQVKERASQLAVERAKFDKMVEHRGEMLSAIAKNTAGLVEVIESARRADEQSRPAPDATSNGKGETDDDRVSPIDWRTFRTHQAQPA